MSNEQFTEFEIFEHFEFFKISIIRFLANFTFSKQFSLQFSKLFQNHKVDAINARHVFESGHSNRTRETRIRSSENTEFAIHFKELAELR